MVLMSDAKKKVLEAFNENGILERSAIEVIDENGIVTLKGTVEKYDSIKFAEQIAKQQPGVIEVINELNVKDGASTPGFPPIHPGPRK